MTKKKVGFDTTGRVHYEGVKNEDVTVDILNEKEIYDETVEKRGGTKCKEDAVAGDQKISIKRKEGITNGSFDWANLSKAVSEGLLGNTFDNFLANMKEIRKLPNSLRYDEELKMKLDSSLKSLCEYSLDTLTQEQIIKILNSALNPSKGFDIVINDVAIRQLYIFRADQHPAFDYIAKDYRIVLKGNGKSSRMVYFADADGNVYDCGLRLRVTSNNGISAFMGISKANRNSQICIKLQQDKVKQLLQQVNAEMVTY